MFTQPLTPFQQSVLEGSALDRRIFLEGTAGTGKTTAGIARLLAMLNSGIPAEQIVVFTPQRSLGLPYIEALRATDLPAGGQVRVSTFSGLAREQVLLYWELLAGPAGFAAGGATPTFLTLETAQYVMAHIVTPLMDAHGYFETVTLPQGRLYSQLIDNLNKAAINGFALAEVGERLKSAWAGDPVQARMFDEVQDVIVRFRAYCLANNLLDFSLLTETFLNHAMPLCGARLFETLPHLIIDNIEEEHTAASRFFGAWVARSQSALVIFDVDAGYRRFLGADEDAAYDLRTACDEEIEFTSSFVMSADVAALTADMARALNEPASSAPGEARNAYTLHQARFMPQTLDWVADATASLVEGGAPPRSIAILAPFMSDALRFSMLERLAARGIRARSHRPSRSLRDEPSVRAMLTFAKLAHSPWGARPSRFDVTHALLAALSATAFGNLDLTRASLLANAAYDILSAPGKLAPFEALPPSLQERLTYTLGEKYDRLREWLDAYTTELDSPPPPPKPKRGRKKAEPAPIAEVAIAQPAIDHFFSRLFGEVLSGRGFGLHRDLIAADAVAALAESARGFRKTLERLGFTPEGEFRASSIGREFITMLEAGVIANQYLPAWVRPDDDAVLVMPAYTFLMNNRPVEHQFWLDSGGRAWSERVFQPLTHPVVLSRQWDGGVWDDTHEQAYRHDAFYRLVVGLLRRCRTHIYWMIAELGETGMEGYGDLYDALNSIMRRHAPPALAERPANDEEMPL